MLWSRPLLILTSYCYGYLRYVKEREGETLPLETEEERVEKSCGGQGGEGRNAWCWACLDSWFVFLCFFRCLDDNELKHFIFFLLAAFASLCLLDAWICLMPLSIFDSFPLLFWLPWCLGDSEYAIWFWVCMFNDDFAPSDDIFWGPWNSNWNLDVWFECLEYLPCIWLPNLMPMMKFSEAYYVGLETGLGSLWCRHESLDLIGLMIGTGFGRPFDMFTVF